MPKAGHAQIGLDRGSCVVVIEHMVSILPDPQQHDGQGPNADGPLTAQHVHHLRVLRLQAALVAVPFIVAAVVLETMGLLPRGLWLIPVLVLAALGIARVPARRYRATGYSVGANRLRIVRGLLVRRDTTVPFGRVQHIDVGQGPLERLYGLATLTVHTAGTHNASVHLPGLGYQDAIAMREAIRAHIERETE